MWKAPAWFCKSSHKNNNVALHWLSQYFRSELLHHPVGRTSIMLSWYKAETPKVVPNFLDPWQSFETREEAKSCLLLQRWSSGPMVEWFYNTLQYSQWAALIQLACSIWVLEFKQIKVSHQESKDSSRKKAYQFSPYKQPSCWAFSH